MNTLTTAEAAAALGLMDSAVRRLCERGLLPGAVRVEEPGKLGRVWRIPRAALAAAAARPKRGWPKGRPRGPKKKSRKKSVRRPNNA